MKKFFIAIISFSISFSVAFLLVRLPASQIPFYGEVFVEDSIQNALIYLLAYLAACVYFAKKYSHAHKPIYIFRLLYFLIITSLLGFAINRYRFADVTVNGIWQ